MENKDSIKDLSFDDKDNPGHNNPEDDKLNKFIIKELKDKIINISRDGKPLPTVTIKKAIPSKDNDYVNLEYYNNKYLYPIRFEKEDIEGFIGGFEMDADGFVFELENPEEYLLKIAKYGDKISPEDTKYINILTGKKILINGKEDIIIEVAPLSDTMVIYFKNAVPDEIDRELIDNLLTGYQIYTSTGATWTLKDFKPVKSKKDSPVEIKETIEYNIGILPNGAADKIIADMKAVNINVEITGGIEKLIILDVSGRDDKSILMIGMFLRDMIQLYS